MAHRLSTVRPCFRRTLVIARVFGEPRGALSLAILCLTVLTLGVAFRLTDALTGAWAGIAGSGDASSLGWWRTESVHAQGTAGSGSLTFFTAFDAPGAGTGALQGTLGTSINDNGDIAGVYLTAPNVAHGFVRTVVNGTASLATFGAPGAGSSLNQGTFPTSINMAGDVAGMYFDANNAYHGFLRVASTGTVTAIDVPGAPTTLGHRGTLPMSLNAGGVITGFYVDSADVRHGFVRSAGGSFTTFDVPGAGMASTDGTVPLSINTAGQITGFYQDASGTFHGFVRAAAGTITAPINAPGAGTGGGGKISFRGTLADSINTAGDIAGIYSDTNGADHGFVYTASSTTPTFTTFDVAGAATTGLIPGTVPLSMNAGGDISGIYTDTAGARHGFLRSGSTSTISAPIDAPSAAATGMFSGTVLININAAGQVTGTFVDASGVFHGFLLAPAAPPPPPAATPTFSPAAGTFTSAQMVTISDATAGAMIHFTTNGNTPTTADPVFTAAIPVNSTTTIKAIATASGFSDSAVAAATYTINLPTPDYQVSVNPSTLTIAAGQSGKATFTVTPQNGFNSQVSFACSGLPAEAACSFVPASVTPNGSAVTSTLTVTTSAPTAAMQQPTPISLRPVYALSFPVLAMMLGVAARRRGVLHGAQVLLPLILLLAAAGLTSCGGGKASGGNPGTPLGTSTVSVSASTSGAGAISHTATLTITITN